MVEDKRGNERGAARRGLPVNEVGEAGSPVGLVVVTPTYNEIDALPMHVARVLALGPDYRLVIVDDESPDGTGELADRFAAEHPGRVEVVHRPRRDGLGGAYRAGIKEALRRDADVLAMMDADGSHDPADLPRLAVAAQRADVVIGSRYAPGGSTSGWPLWRRLLSRLGGRYAGFVLGLQIADPTSGFRVMHRAAAESIDIDRMLATGYAVNIELTWRALRAGLRVAEVPIVFRERVVGVSKLDPGIVAEAAVLVWRLRFGDVSPGIGSNDRTARRGTAR